MGAMTNEELSAKMSHDWDERAKLNANYFIVDSNATWNREQFYALGRSSVTGHILSDMVNICQEKLPAEMKVLEIGCGAGRVTKSLAAVFGQIFAVDLSREMIRLAEEACRENANVHLIQNNGMDLNVLPESDSFDFAFSMCCFHHIPSQKIIESYLKDVARLLRQGCLFKFEVQGYTNATSQADDTWIGAQFSDAAVDEMAERCGFEPRYRVGEAPDRLWLWFFKK